MSMNAWPALQTLVYDGWVLRFANGYTRRANSVNPIYPSQLDTLEKIAYCRRLYAARGLRTIFKLTQEVYPQDLDDILEKNGYTHEAETSVQTITMNRIDVTDFGKVRIVTHVEDEWIDAFFRMAETASEHRATLRTMLRSIMMPKCLAYIKYRGAIVACGLGVMEEDLIGLFEIVVDKKYRGRGFGRQIVQGMLLWAKKEGIKSSYLQVMVDNKKAMTLYRQLGFNEIYRYWYRTLGVKPSD
jgi:GNAT superfamily N-acetyltransferase